MHTAGSSMCGGTPSAVHSLTTTSRGSPAGPRRASMTLTRSTWAALPMSRNTAGIVPRTSGASSSIRLALAEATSNASRRLRDSLIWLSSSVQGVGRVRVSRWARVGSTTETLMRHISLSGNRGVSVPRQGGCLPTSPQRLVDGDQAGGSLRTAARQGVLGLELRPLRIQDGQKVHHTAFVADLRKLGGGRTGTCRVLSVQQLVAVPCVRDQRILSLFQRVQDGSVVLIQGDHRPGPRARNLGVHAPEVEGGPGDARADHVAARSRGAQAGGLGGRIAEVAGESDFREEIRDGHSNESRGRREVALGGANVGATPQQLFRRADRHDLRQRRQLMRGAQYARQRIRVAPGQDTEAVNGAGDGGLQGTDGRERRAELGLRARHVEIGSAARLELRLCERQYLLLVLDVGAGYGQLSLLTAQLEVVACDLGDDRHLRIVQVGHLAFQLGIACLDAAAYAAEEIELPRGVEPGVIELARIRAAAGILDGRHALLGVAARGGDRRSEVEPRFIAQR